MSTTVDERVVEMRFDNKQFEAGVQTSLSTIEKLKQSLKLEGASKGLENVQATAKNMTMSGLTSALDTVHAKFSALEVMGMTALANITNSVVNTGKKIVAAFTIDPIKTGFSEYETQINAVQTILANTSKEGTTLDQVNRALDELNTYADKTIYNFTEMTRNIGTFTAAGVDLKTSVSAIQGIANLAAVSGSTSQQASTAMYQLSQALSAGTVKLMDWNSVVNAGMGGQVFQDALKETARLHGIAIDQMIEDEGSFRETLQNGWLSAEILTETLSKFTTSGVNEYLAENSDLTIKEIENLREQAIATGDSTKAYKEMAKTLAESSQLTEEQIFELLNMSTTAEDAATKVKTFTQLMDTLKEAAQSGWTQTWEILVGDFEEAKELFTEVSTIFGDMISESANARNSMLEGAFTSGWKQLLSQGIDDAEGFKETISEVAKEHDVALEDMISKHGTFEKSLSEGWLTADILTESISKMTEEISGLSEEELQARGYTMKQVESLKELDEAVKNGSLSMEEFSEIIARPSGRELVVDSLRNGLNALLSIINPVKEAFREIFPPTTSDQVYALLEGLKEFSSHLILTDTQSENLKRTFKGLFALLDIGRQAFSAVLSVVTPLIGGLTGLGDGILEVTGSWGDWAVQLNETIKTTNVFGKAAQKVTGFINNVGQALLTAKEAVQSFIGKVKEKVDFPGMELFHSVLNRAQERLTSFLTTLSDIKLGTVTILEAMGDALANSKFLQALQALWDGTKYIASSIASVLGDFMGGAVDAIADADFNGIIDMVNSLIAGGIGVGLINFLKSVTDTFHSLQDITDGVVNVLDGVRGCFEAYQTQLKAGTLLKIAGAIGILTASILVISLIDSKKLSASLGAVTVLFADLMGAMAIFGKVSGDLTGVAKSVTAMIGLSTAVLILASALKKIGELETEEIVKGLVGVIGLTATMVAAMTYLSNNANKAVKGATQMVIFAAAIKVLASACKDLSTLEWEDLVQGLVGVGALLAGVSLFLNHTKLEGKSITTATGIVILAAAMKVMASACKDFGQLDGEALTKGLLSIGLLLGGFTAFTKFAGNAQNILSMGVSLVTIAAAMKVFASATKDFGGMNWEEIAKGLLSMGVALAAVTVAVNFMPNNMIQIGTGLIAIGAALVIMAEAMKRMSGMGWEELARGLAVLGGSLWIIQKAVKAMQGTISGAAALVVMAGALAILTPVISVLGAMPFENIGKALLTLAGTFVVLGVAGAVLTPLVPTILSLAGSFALIGAGVALVGAGLLAAGAGLSAIAVGFTALATAGAAGATAFVAALTVIVTGVLSLIPAILSTLGEAIVAVCEAIISAAPAIGEAVVAVVLSIVGVLVECVPALAEGVLEIVTGVMAALATYAPQIVTSLMEFLIGILESLASKLPELIVAAVNVIMAFFQGVVDALSGIDTDTLLKGIVGVGLLSALMLALSAVASLVPGAMVGVLGMGVVIAELALVLAAIGALAQIPGLQWLIEEGGNFLQAVGVAIGQFVGGIVGGFASGVSSQFPQIGSDLSAFMTNVQPFLDGAKMIDASMMEGVKALAQTILILTAADILDGLTSWFTGGSSMAAFGEELAAFGPHFYNYYEAIKGVDGTVVEASSNAALALAEMASKLPNSGGVVGWFAGENSLSAFAEELVDFGPKLKAYADSVRGLDGDVVVSSANAAMALAEMATKLPNQGGVVGWFAGENSLSIFAEELAEFGPVLKKYADSVRGLDADVVVASTNAAMAIAEMANNLPNQGGAVSWFTGDNTLSVFGEELAKFGPSLKSYADSVTGMDAAVVVNSANAAKALSELASNLPNTGGLVSWFTGDNDIGAFGESLVSFGENFRQYAIYMKDVDAGIVTATTNAANSIVNLQKSLPKEGGWFSDDMTLADFGSDMSSFGSYFAAYYGYISGINIEQLSGVIAETNSLVAMANGMAGLDTSGMTNFGAALTTLGENGVTGFINAFTNANARVTTAASNMLTAFINGANAKQAALITTFTTLVQAVITAINNKQPLFTTTFTTIISACLTVIKNKYTEFQNVGTQTMVKFIAGVKSKDTSARTTFTTIISGCLTVIKNKYSEFQSVGAECMVEFIAGVKSKDTDTKSAFTNSLSGAITGIKDYQDDFYSAGSYLVDGFADGISANTYKAEAKARAMAAAAANAAKDELDEHSPSRVFYDIGDFAGIAFVNALGDYQKESAKAGGSMAGAAIEGLRNAISVVKDLIIDGIDPNPTIRPVLDLSNVEAGTSRLSAMFGRTQAVSISHSMNNRTDNPGIQNGAKSPYGNTYNLTQNNYSPKALSRVEIYRQTKNQFSTLERMVES